MKKFIVIISLILVGLTVCWYFDIGHKPVETIDKLIGQNYDYAYKFYFRKPFNHQYSVSINDNLYEIDNGILNKKKILTDTIVHVFTWDYKTYKKTIWVGKTEKCEHQVIDAIRYNNDVQF